MGFKIPNYTEAVATGVGDQAEPDSVDFQILGNPASGVVFDPTNYPTNAAVSPSSGNDVSIATYKVIIDGIYYHKDSTTTLSLDGGDSNPRFDLVVIPKATPLAPTFRKGAASSTNPQFPSIVDGDTVLAAIYRAGPGSAGFVTSANIVDKRLFIPSNTTWISASEPTLAPNSDGAKAANGDVWVTTASAAVGKSNVWVKSAGTWENLAEYVAMSSANTANNIVQRDASGNFAANVITGTTFTGKANTAGVADSANAVSWSNVSGIPAIVYNNGALYNISVTGSAGSAGYATSAGNADTTDGYHVSNTWNAADTIAMRDGSNTLWTFRIGADRVRNNNWNSYTTFEDQFGNDLVRISNAQSVFALAVSGRAVQINSNGTLGTVASTRRVKENIVNYESSALLNVSPVTFDYKEGALEKGENRHNHFGLVAEDLAEVGLEHLVYRARDGKIEGVAYEKVAVELLSVVKTLAARIEALEKKKK